MGTFDSFPLLAFLLLLLSFLVFLVAQFFHKPTAEAAFLVTASMLGVLFLFVSVSAYQDGHINPVPAGRFFKRLILQANEPLLFHLVAGAFAVVGLGLAALVPVALWRLVARIRSNPAESPKPLR